MLNNIEIKDNERKSVSIPAGIETNKGRSQEDVPGKLLNNLINSQGQ